MKGFDPRWRDLPDYILGITYEIWEERRVETLNGYYSADIPVRSPDGVIFGAKEVIAATYATLDEFPDRRMLGEDVIWSGTPEAGMLSSHRIFNIATHRGGGVYGEATGRQVTYRAIADCHAVNNQINDEWLVRDQGAIVRQLGMEPQVFARERIEAEGGPDVCSRPFTPRSDVDGPYAGRGDDNAWGARYADVIDRFMSGDATGAVAAYDRACALHHPGGADARGPEAARAFWGGLRAAFPSADFAIRHQIGREDQGMPPRAALRWSLTGKHDGDGPFGPATGADVHVMGMAHAEFGLWGLRREYALFDETAIWKQIILHTG